MTNAKSLARVACENSIAERTLLQLNKHATKGSTVDSSVSFELFVEFLKGKIATGQGARVEFFRNVLKKFEACTEPLGDIRIEETGKYKELLEIILSVVLPFSADENEALIGFGNGLSTEVFYCTDAFYSFLVPYCSIENRNTFGTSEISMQVHKELQYNFILKKLYGITSLQQKEWVQQVIQPETGLYKYYRLNIDTRFVEVELKSPLPPSNPFTIKSHLACADGLDNIEDILPLENFRAKGFTIFTLTDITAQQAVEEIAKVVINLNEKNSEASYREINGLLQALVGSKEYRFGIMPFFTINGRAAILYENFPYSIIVKACWSAGITKEDLSAFINSFLLNPRLITFRAALKTGELPEVIQEALVIFSISFYALVPVYYNSILVGLCESATTSDVPMHDAFQLNTIKHALPYISQLLRLSIDKFNNAIEATIKDKFTSIQPAVQWKFNEVAWRYFRSNEIEHKHIALENITFKDVYPLYGEVDIRNSTIERNKALRGDFLLQIELLTEIFAALSKVFSTADIMGLLKKCNHWSHHLIHDISIEELQLGEFILKQVHPLLQSLTDLPLGLEEKITEYWKSIDAQTGMLFQKRKKLENSIQIINNGLSQYFNKFKEDLQTLYPCYFETFRTDGIEYDIYIGQSIAPKIPFNPDYLQKLRLWQVESLATIAKTTLSLLPQLEHPLDTTQLLFVNSRTIDITFRNDERRFDVEGTYNIRYHVIKKRIDKVSILDSTERLTQPGKIAIVYFDEKHADEYVGYIRQLQHEQKLQNDLEYLELEELQGVTGLRALRVGVKLD